MAAENNIVGEVGLRVTPVDTTFNRDLQRIIDKAPKFVDQKISPKVDTAAFDKATTDITKGAASASASATDALSNIGAGINTAQFDAATNQLVQGAEQAAEQASSSFAKIAVGVGVGAAAIYGLKQAVDITVRSLSGLFDNLLKAQAGFQAILGNVEGDKLLADIQEFARVTPFSTESLVQYSQQLLGVGRSAESIIPTLSAVGDLVASKGGDTQTISRVLFTLTQIQSVGRLIGQDAMQLQSALIPITKLLADSMGKTQAEIKALQAAGKISADTVFKTLEDAGLDVAGAMDGATRNIGGAKEALTDTVQILLQKSPVLIKLNQDIVNAIKNLTNFLGEPRVAELTDKLSVSLENLYVAIQPIFGALTSIAGETILTTLEAALPLLQGVGAVLQSIPVSVLTAIGAFLAFNKFQTFITGFGKATSLLTNFQGTLGGIAGGLNRATTALTASNNANAQAQASQAALIRTYNQTGAAASTAAIQTEAYTQALRRQSIEAQKAVAAAFAAPPTGPMAGTGQAKKPGLLGGRAAGIGTAAVGAAGFLALSQSGDVDGAAGDALGIAGSAATGAAAGAIFGPYGIAAGAAAGLAFGVFTEFNKNAREDAEKKAAEWGKIGAKSAQAFVEGFNRDFNVDPGGTAEASERIKKSAQIAADVATLKVAQETGVVGEATKAAAERLGIKLEIDTDKPQLGITETPGGFTPAALVGRGLGLLGLGPEPEQGEFIDRGAFGAQIADITVVGEERAAELAKQRKVVEGIIGNPIAATWFDNIREREIGEIVAPFGAVGEAVRGAVDAGAGLVVPFDLVGRSLEESFDYLQDFGIGLVEAEKLADKVAFYFNDTLGALQASVDASQKWNTALGETKAALEGINKEVLAEASARLAGINDAEAGEKRILALREGASSKDVAGAAIEALKSAQTQAALDTAGGTIEDSVIRQNQLFVASIKDIQEQVGLTDEQLQEYLRTVGLADQFNIASESETTRIAEIRAEIERLEAFQAETGPRNKGRIAAQVAELERQIAAVEGVSTAESRLQQERDERNANALPLIKAAEGVQAAYAAAVAATIDGSVKLSQFGDTAQQALGRAQAQGETTAEDNQIFVDSIEQIQLAYQYTDAQVLEYLDSVGLLDAYNKALVDSNTGVTTTVAEMAEQYGLTTDEVRELFGLIEEIPNDATIYISAEIADAIAALDVVEQRIIDLTAAAADPNASGQERAAANRALDEARRREQELEDEIRAAGGDVNAVTGTKARIEAEAKKKADEEAAKNAEKLRKEQEAAAKQAQQELERWQNLVESTTSNLTSQLESAAQSVADAAERWVGSIKERTEYEVAVSASRLASNAERQTRDLQESQAGLENLRGRGVTDEVLQALGIDNVGDTRQIRKLVNSSDSDLQRLTASVSTRDEAAQKLALSEEDKRTRTNITAAIVDAAKALDLDLSNEQATAISNQFNITPNLNAEELAFQILGILSGGRITR